MKAPIFFALLALAPLTACGGGGSSAPTITYSPVGSYTGTVTSPYEGQGVMGLVINADSSGEFAVHYPSAQAVDLTFPGTIGHVSGSDFDIQNATIGLNGVDTGCPFNLHAEAKSTNEVDGSYSVGDGSSTCGPKTTIPFQLVRSNTTTQDFAKQHASQPLIKH